MNLDRPEVARVVAALRDADIPEAQLDLVLEQFSEETPESAVPSLEVFAEASLPDRVAALIDSGIPRYSAEGIVRTVLDTLQAQAERDEERRRDGL